MAMKTLTPEGRVAKVWPLVAGLRGRDARGNPKELEPGVAGYMLLREALEREKKGELDVMAGKTYAELREPTPDKRAMGAQAPEDLDSVPDEEDAPAHALGQSQVRRKKRTYKRRDVTAEKP